MPLIDRILFSDKAPSLMKKSLNMMSTRQNLISSNISNVDTPGFKASDIDFQGQLREALGSKGGLNLKSTNEKHFGPNTSSIGDITPDPFEEDGLLNLMEIMSILTAKWQKWPKTRLCITQRFS